MIQGFDKSHSSSIPHNTQVIPADAVGNSGALWIFTSQSVNLQDFENLMN